MNTTKTFTPYLVQRIERMAAGVRAPFGRLLGYYQSGVQLSDDERDALRAILPLDYMGSAEFEFGAVFKGFAKMAKLSDFEISRVEFSGRPYDICLRQDEIDAMPAAGATAYVLAENGMLDDIRAYVESNLRDRFNHRHREMPYYDRGLFGEARARYGSQRRRLKGSVHQPSNLSMWFDLENFWVMGTDLTQVEYLVQLLGVSVRKRDGV